MDEVEAAKHLYYEALAALRLEVGDRHADTLTAMNNLGTLLKMQGEHEEAVRAELSR